MIDFFNCTTFIPVWKCLYVKELDWNVTLLHFLLLSCCCCCCCCCCFYCCCCSCRQLPSVILNRQSNWNCQYACLWQKWKNLKLKSIYLLVYSIFYPTRSAKPDTLLHLAFERGQIESLPQPVSEWCSYQACLSTADGSRQNFIALFGAQYLYSTFTNG